MRKVKWVNDNRLGFEGCHPVLSNLIAIYRGCFIEVKFSKQTNNWHFILDNGNLSKGYVNRSKCKESCVLYIDYVLSGNLTDKALELF